MDPDSNLELDDRSLTPDASLEPADSLEQRLVIAIDYGTTFTGIAYATPRGNKAVLDEIDILADWSADMINKDKVPSVISYQESDPTKRNWGLSLSADAIAMKHTKIQLQVQNNSEELDSVINVLEGTHNLNFGYIAATDKSLERSHAVLPQYTWKTPEEIVVDYMERVFKAFLLRLEEHVSLIEEARGTFPTDIILTIPAEWAYRAKNALFRALNKAGFNSQTFPLLKEILVVSEPEAAAIYTARSLKEKNITGFLSKDDCFVLCDAGGGTVDVIAYKVKQVEPSFEIEAITKPKGYTCGSIFIDMRFKVWLRKLLGESIYRQLDQEQVAQKISSHSTEGPLMRDLIKDFTDLKENFRNDSPDMSLDLPGPLRNLVLENRVYQGEITITNAQMKEFFAFSVGQTIGLLRKQVEIVQDDQGRRVKNLFLVGGLSQSPYLQEMIQKSISLKAINVRKPDEGWTAVVRGALIFGIEKLHNESIPRMSAARRNYAIVVGTVFEKDQEDIKNSKVDPLSGATIAEEQILWLIKEGDLIMSDEPKRLERWFQRKFSDTSARDGKIALYSFEGNDLPTNFRSSRNEFTLVAQLEYDLSRFPLSNFLEERQTQHGHTYYIAWLNLKIQLDLQTLRAQLFCGEELLQELTRPYA